MSDKNESEVPRRKALLTTASVGSALVGFSTGAVARGQSNGNRTTTGRPPNDDLPPAADENRSDEMPTSEGEIPEGWIDDEGNFTIPKSELDEAFDVKVYDGKTGRELDDVETDVVNVRNDHGLLDRHGDDVSTQIVKFEETLWSGTAGNVTLRLKASFEIDLSAPEVSVNLRLQANGVAFDVLSLGITPGDDRLFCIEPKAHPTIPLDIAICPDFFWQHGSSKFDIGATGEACIGIDCPWATCDVCRSISFDATVDIEEQEVTFE